MAVTHCRAVRVALALRAHDIVDLVLEQLVQHPEPGRNAERQQPLPRCPDQLAQRLLHPGGQHGAVTAAATDTVCFTAVPILSGSPRTLPTATGRRDRRP
jgi:hypothetical protein